jgi:hypothetical protein
VEDLRSKTGNKDFLDALNEHDIFAIGTGFEAFEIISYPKGRGKLTKFGRNPGLAAYIRESVSARVIEIELTNSVVQEPEGSSPHSQQPATGPCPEPVDSNAHPPSQSP